VSDPREVEDLIHDAIVQLFKDAKVWFERTDARGVKYRLAEIAYAQFSHKCDMPWERSEGVDYSDGEDKNW
jgi:hypothetical protein